MGIGNDRKSNVNEGTLTPTIIQYMERLLFVLGQNGNAYETPPLRNKNYSLRNSLRNWGLVPPRS
ncbi:uncharacterized protein G2W53_019948 [Senna tora]|uniref:Uncharacterized protein n=1 Tax=Senna tora TaxID=362788 RepID=A0A834WS63_9FABA|nr:uncharacterized protein G2W53_019948 [Senna tora]